MNPIIPLMTHQTLLLSLQLPLLKKVGCPHPIPCPQDLSMHPLLEIAKAGEEKRQKRIEEGEEETKNNEKPANEDRRGRIGDRKRRRGNFAVIDTSPSLDGERRIRKRRS